MIYFFQVFANIKVETEIDMGSMATKSIDHFPISNQMHDLKSAVYEVSGMYLNDHNFQISLQYGIDVSNRKPFTDGIIVDAFDIRENNDQFPTIAVTTSKCAKCPN